MLNKNNKLKVTGVLILVLSLFVFIGVFPGITKLQGSFFGIVSLPEKAFFSVGGFFSDIFKVLFTLDDMLDENAKLRFENRELLSKLIDKEKLKEENILLREQLNFKQKQEQELLEAKIVSFEPSNLSEFLVINKGFSSFVKKDMPVILPGGVLLGKVFEVYKDYSKVMLILDKNNKVNVKSFFYKDESRESYSGILNGHFGKALFMDLVEKQSLILKNDLIISSGFDGIYPEGLVIGRVDIVKDDDNSVFKQVYLKPEFLPIKSTLVFVILK